MLSTLLLVAAMACTLFGAALHRRLSGWRRIALHGAGPVLLALALVTVPSFSLIDKMISTLLFPPGLLWMAGFALTWWLLLRGHRRGAALALAAWLLFSTAGNSWLGRAMLGWLEEGYQPPAKDARFDVVAVLGGATQTTPWGEPQLSHAGDRVRMGADLYARGQAAKLVCTGVSIAGLSNAFVRDLSDETADLWVGMGVPRQAIVQARGPHNTRAEIIRLAELASERGWKSIGLVTSAWHLRRAMKLAERHGLDATPIPADVRGMMPPASMVTIIPSGSGFYAVQIAWKEILGALVGR